MKENTLLKIVLCFFAVIIMGFALSWFIIINLGTESCSVMNLGIAHKVGISFGNWMLIYNCILLCIIFAVDRKKIGLGTIFNMVLVGYSCDFFSWVWRNLGIDGKPDSMMVRLGIMVIMLVVFVVAASVYMCVDIGVSPYDAVPMILFEHQKKLPFRFVRIIWDMTAIFIGFVLGSTVGIVTVLAAFVLGPVIEGMKPYVGKMVNRGALYEVKKK